MDLFNQIYNHFVGTISENPLASGAMYVYLLGTATWLLRNVPKKIFQFIKGQTTTSLVLNNSGVTEAQFISFMDWFSTSKWAKYSRSMALDVDYNDFSKPVIGPGFGWHFFFYKAWPFVFYKEKLESSGTYMEKAQITIYTLGRRRTRIIDLVDDFKYKPNKNSIRIFSTTKDDGWRFLTDIKPRKIKTVILEKEQKNHITSTLDHFFGNKEWFEDRGMPYKKTFIIHGEPGTGKSSIIKSLASYYNRNVYILNLSLVTDSELQRLVSTMEKGSFLLIEDFDSCGTTHSRVEKDGKDGATKTFNVGITLSGLLNTLDGVVSLDDVVIFMTTNHLEKIDPAITRKGRVDHIVEIGKFTDKEVREYIELMYPDYEIPKDIVFDSIKGCDIQSIFLENRNSPDEFIQAIPKIKSNTIVYKRKDTV